LPGILNDRFYNMCLNKEQQQVLESNFTDNFIKVFMSSIDTKMRLTFNM
jgi:hypothetical protein